METQYAVDNFWTPSDTVYFTQNEYVADPERYHWIHPGRGYCKFIFSSRGTKVLKDRITTGFQYLPQYSYFPRAKEVEKGLPINILEVINRMMGSSLTRITQQIRDAQEIGDKELKSRLKNEQLPYICHTGIFLPRRNDGLIQPAFTYQLDIDKIPNPDKLLQTLIKDKSLNILFASVSVSGNGLKGMLFLKELLFIQDTWTHEQYRSVYHQATDILADYFSKTHGVSIDKQMKAISQPFFLFHAPDLYVHKNLQKWI